MNSGESSVCLYLCKYATWQKKSYYKNIFPVYKYQIMEMANSFIFYTEKVRKEKLENRTLICKFMLKE